MTPRVLIGFPANPEDKLFVLGVSLLGGGDLLVPADGGYVDVTEWLDGEIEFPITISRGRAGPLGDYETATCDLHFRNTDGRFDPLNDEGPYTADGATFVRCGRRVIVAMVRPDGTVEQRFGGQIEAYVPNPRQRDWPLMKISCKGPMALVARVDPLASAAAGGGEDSGARQHRLADLAGVPGGDREFATGNVTLQPTTGAQNVLTEMRLVAASESPLGALYENRFGRLQHDNRRALLDVERSRDVQATFAPPGVPDTLPYVDLGPAFDKQRLQNDVAASRIGGEQITAEDATSIAEHLRYTIRRTDLLLETDAAVAEWVQWRLLFFSDAEYRYDTVSLDALNCAPAQRVAMAETMIVRELRDRIAVVDRVRYNDPDTGTFVRENIVEVFIERIDERIGWRAYQMDLELSSAEKLSDPFILGVSVLGGTDRLMPL